MIKRVYAERNHFDADASPDTANEDSSSSSRRVISSTAESVSINSSIGSGGTRIDTHFPNISLDTWSNLCCNWSSSSSTAALNWPCASVSYIMLDAAGMRHEVGDMWWRDYLLRFEGFAGTSHGGTVVGHCALNPQRTCTVLEMFLYSRSWECSTFTLKWLVRNKVNDIRINSFRSDALVLIPLVW